MTPPMKSHQPELRTAVRHTRHRFLTPTAAAAALAFATDLPAVGAASATEPDAGKVTENPFIPGVASGDPLPGSCGSPGAGTPRLLHGVQAPGRRGSGPGRRLVRHRSRRTRAHPGPNRPSPAHVRRYRVRHGGTPNHRRPTEQKRPSAPRSEVYAMSEKESRNPDREDQPRRDLGPGATPARSARRRSGSYPERRARTRATPRRAEQPTANPSRAWNRPARRACSAPPRAVPPTPPPTASAPGDPGKPERRSL